MKQEIEITFVHDGVTYKATAIGELPEAVVVNDDPAPEPEAVGKVSASPELVKRPNSKLDSSELYLEVAPPSDALPYLELYILVGDKADEEKCKVTSRLGKYEGKAKLEDGVYGRKFTGLPTDGRKLVAEVAIVKAIEGTDKANYGPGGVVRKLYRFTAHEGSDMKHKKPADNGATEILKSEGKKETDKPKSKIELVKSGRHNNVGRQADGGQFKKPTVHMKKDGRMVMNNVKNFTLDGFKIENIKYEGDVYNFLAGIEMNNCENIHLKNFTVRVPQRWREKWKSKKGPARIATCISGKRCKNITLENFNTEFGFSAWRFWESTGITIRNAMSKDAGMHHLHIGQTPPTDGLRVLVENCYMYRSAEIFSPYEMTSAMDPINIAGISKGGKGERPIIRKVFVNSGRGLHGSGGCIVEGPDYKGKESGGVLFEDMTALDTGNKFFGHAGGNGTTFRRCWGYQDDPLHAEVRKGVMKLGYNPKKHPHAFKYGDVVGYHFDFRSSAKGGPNQQDKNFGKGEWDACLTHWVKEGRVYGFASEEQIGVGSNGLRFWTPKGNEARFINDNRFDADKVRRITRKGEKMGTKNYDKPSITRAECVARGKEHCKDIPMWSNFPDGSMYFAELNGE